MKKAPIVDPLSTTDGDEALYGPATLPPVRANAVQRIPLEKVRPDWKQPRRVIPLTAIFHDWQSVSRSKLIVVWKSQVCDELRRDGTWINTCLPKWLRGAEPLPDLAYDKGGLAAGFFEVVSLAASIYRDGLTNPITVVQQGEGYVIETGERRFLAYSLLSRELLSDGKWDQVPALVVQKSDVWRQAAENGSRQPLNAIGMARQIALLIMDMYRGDEGVRFDSFEDMVMPGECDQRFYAQVRNGVTYPIKKGELERVLHATGLKSSAQVSQYRALLDIDPDLWMRADAESLAEGAIRALRAPEKPAPQPDRFTAVNAPAPAPRIGPRVRYEPDPDYVPEQEPVIEAGTEPALTLQVNDRVIVDGTRPGVIRYVDERKGTYGVFLDASSTTHHYAPDRVRLEMAAPEPQSAPEPAQEMVLVYPEDDPQLLQLLELAQSMAGTMGLAKAAQSFNLLKSLRPEAVNHMKRNPVSAETLLRRYELDAQDLVNALAEALQGYLDGLRSELRG